MKLEKAQVESYLRGKKLAIPGQPRFLATRNKEYRTLINIPGLWIQGCSFKNLEKNSQWSKAGLELMKQYGARFE